MAGHLPRIGLGAALSALFLVPGGLLAYQAVYQGSEFSLVSGMRLGAPFRLVDQNGDPITQEAFEGHPNLVYFGFTRCPEVCPTTLYEMAGWLDTLGEEGRDIRAFFISVDPERDTPDIMKGYADAFTDRITGITGDPEEVAGLVRAWRVYAAKVPLEDGDYTMDHTASVFLVASDGSFLGTIAYGEDAETALKKLRNLVRRSGES